MSPWKFSLLGYQLAFAQPWYLLAGIAAVLVGVVGIVLAFRRKSAALKAVNPRLLELVAPGISQVRPALQSVFYAVGLLFFALGLGQPQCGSKTELTKRRGIDVVVAIDASKSMLARDVQPSRIERAKLELTTLLDELKGDRVAIVAFAGDAFIQCPLTSDYSAAKMFLRAIDPDAMPQGGTNIGAALMLSRQLFESADRGAKDRVVVLISDGEDLEGEITDGIDQLKEFQARVLAVGIGSEAGETIPILNKQGAVIGYKKDAQGNTVLTRLDSAGLSRIARDTGGEYFHQPRSVAMGEVVKVIDTLQKTELESRLTVKYAEGFQSFVALGLFFVVVGMLIRPSSRRRATA